MTDIDQYCCASAAALEQIASADTTLFLMLLLCRVCTASMMVPSAVSARMHCMLHFAHLVTSAETRRTIEWRHVLQAQAAQPELPVLVSLEHPFRTQHTLSLKQAT